MAFARLAVFGLVGFGLFVSGRLAWLEWATGEACPVVGSVPACYVAFAGYLTMVIGLAVIATSGEAWARSLFYAGVGVAGGLALLGSALELVNGNICPRAGRVPMCYISLAMSILIGGLFWRMTEKARYGISEDPSSQNELASENRE